MLTSLSLRLRRALPSLAVASLALYVLALGSSWVHFAHTVHVRCAEHGELVEQHADHSETAALPLDSALPGEDPGSHEHEHCGFALLASQSSLASSSACAVSGCEAESASRYIDATEAVRCIPLLALAPKGSPPLAQS